MELEPGSYFAGYRVEAKLGQGGMGAVFRVRHEELDRIEALKIISAGLGSEEFVKRFVNEARLAAKLVHPGIVTIYHAGVFQGMPWYTMEFLESIDLSHTGGLEIGEVADVLTKSAEAVDYAHQNGVIHRDIKPTNIALVRDRMTEQIQRVVVMDFGLAKALGGEQLTAQRTFMATLNYAAPETVHGAPASPASDQYSLACTIFELLAGRPPYIAANATELVAIQAQAPITPLGTVIGALAPLDPVLTRALAKDPALRYPDCRSFAADFVAAARRVAPEYRTVALTAWQPGGGGAQRLSEQVTTVVGAVDGETGEIPRPAAMPPQPQLPMPPSPMRQLPPPMPPQAPPPGSHPTNETSAAVAVLVGTVIGLLIVLALVLGLTLG